MEAGRTRDPRDIPFGEYSTGPLDLVNQESSFLNRQTEVEVYSWAAARENAP